MARTESRPPWTPPRVRLVLLILSLIIALNAFDTWATLIVVSAVGAGEEYNPLMRFLLEAGPAWFVAGKMGMIVGFASALAWMSRRRRLAWYGLCGIAALYLALVAYQAAVFVIAPPPTFDPFPSAAPIAADFL